MYLHLLQDARTSSIGGSSNQDSSKISLKPPTGNGNISSTGNPQLAGMPRNASFSSAQLLAQRKLFAESQIGRSSFHKLLEPSSSQRPGIAPYRIVLGDIKEKVPLFTYFFF